MFLILSTLMNDHVTGLGLYRLCIGVLSPFPNLALTLRMSLKYDETEERTTLCASSVDPSAHARVTSTKSCLACRSRKVEATLTVKSFHLRLYF